MIETNCGVIYADGSYGCGQQCFSANSYAPATASFTTAAYINVDTSLVQVGTNINCCDITTTWIPYSETEVRVQILSEGNCNVPSISTSIPLSPLPQNVTVDYTTIFTLFQSYECPEETNWCGTSCCPKGTICSNPNEGSCCPTIETNDCPVDN